MRTPWSLHEYQPGHTSAAPGDWPSKRAKRAPSPQLATLPIFFTVPWSRPYFLMTFLSCNMSNSSVASLPAKSMIAFLPPGCSDKKLVTSYTSSPTMHQQSESALCFATSSSVTDITVTGAASSEKARGQLTGCESQVLEPK